MMRNDRDEAATGLPEMTLTRRFSAPPEVVFRAWIDPERLAEWWGPKGFRNPVCMANGRPGGGIRIDMLSPDGVVYPMRGRYVEVVAPERLVFTTEALDDEGQPIFEVRNTILFAATASGTEISLQARVVSVTADAPRYLSGMSQGWRESMDRLAELVLRSEMAAVTV